MVFILSVKTDLIWDMMYSGLITLQASVINTSNKLNITLKLLVYIKITTKIF